MTDLHQTYYRQVKNPNPVFTPREGAGTLKFCEKLMEKAVGFSSRFDFAIHVAHARSRGLRRRMPPVLRRRAIDALLQGLCFHYDPLANRVQCSITTLAIECGLATESGAGKLSITRATRALTFLSGHCCKVSDEAAFCLIQRPYISKTLLTRRISPRGSP